MKRRANLLALSAVGAWFSLTPLSAHAIEPMWLTAVCLDVRLSVWDKFSVAPFKVRYLVREVGGREFVVERTVSGPNDAEVHFPRDFADARGPSAAIDCNRGRVYSWQIFAGERLIDSGAFSFARDKKQ